MKADFLQEVEILNLVKLKDSVVHEAKVQTIENTLVIKDKNQEQLKTPQTKLDAEQHIEELKLNGCANVFYGNDSTQEYGVGHAGRKPSNCEKPTRLLKLS